MKNIIYILSIFGNLSFVHAQETVLISKDEVLTKVRENNNSLKMSEQDVLAAKGDFNQSNAVILPNISVSHTAIATTNPLMAFGSKLNQEILTQADFNPTFIEQSQSDRGLCYANRSSAAFGKSGWYFSA